jgi:ankyrin repeat protein
MLEIESYSVLSKSASGWTILQRAAWKGQEVVVQLLIQKGEDVAILYYKTGWNVLHLVAFNSHNRVIQLLLWFGANIKTLEYYGLVALYLAVEYSFKTSLRLLLGNRASIATRNNNR